MMPNEDIMYSSMYHSRGVEMANKKPYKPLSSDTSDDNSDESGELSESDDSRLA